MNLKIILMVINSFCLLPSRGYNILLLPAGLETHQILFGRVGEDLVKHGHKVTFLIGDKKTLVPDVKVNFKRMIIDSVHWRIRGREAPSVQFLLYFYASPTVWEILDPSLV